ncbi:lipase [Colletotrichum gloeosporioides Cg-14]|uniref:sn-1-specific diacylglycerol lipase n=2 Tax=Colletotrichum gloeosporioides species complex TaxID=2707338 RepID=T0KME2_COLGC|nr:lipase [Colletotrichum gloeosporioides Cg-14]
MPILRALDDTHHEIRSFAHHTESEAASILLASFVDPQGGSDTTGSTGTGVPLVHYISLDHESKAVVLACRGTLGFEDVLADMACDYDNLYWRGKSYKVHKGIHASARRLLYGGDGRVLYTLKEALDEFSDYGLVLCGHSLGGGVTALLGTMLAEPSATGTGFVTSSEPHRRLLGDGRFLETDTTHVCLPSGRPIHVYAYGPPGTMSPSLRKATRGLVTSVVHGSDLVPFLSLGVLHDFQAVALAFKSDNHEAKGEVRQRIWQAFQSGLADKWYTNSSRSSSAEEDKWSVSALTTLRSNMMSLKLLPPGEVFLVESTRVLRRDAFLLSDEEDIGRPAQRIVLKYVRDVESRFREVRFGTSMLIDHSPAKYEEALNKLRFGVVETA